MKKKIIKSYAKINLSLNVLGKYKNGYHKIQSIISFLDFHDRVHIKTTNRKKHIIKFKGAFSQNLKINTISKLLYILEKKKLLKNNYKIEVIKNIPQKSGLGGGSMNAANIFSYFLKNKIVNLSKKEVFNICNQIGSDVFIGLNRKNSILINNKTIKRYNKKVDLFAVLVKPNIGCATGKIYSGIKGFSKGKIKISSKVFKINMLKDEQNDLEKPAFKLYPILLKLKIFLSKIDQVKFVRMTGSGSIMIAYFSNRKSAVNALKLVKKNFKNCWSILSKTI